MPRKTRRRSRGNKTVNIANFAVGINAVAQMAEPFLRAGLIQAVTAKDAGAVIASLRTGGREAVMLGNLIEAAAPAVILGVARAIISMFGGRAPSFRMGRRRVAAF